MSEFICCGCQKPLPLGESEASMSCKVHTYERAKDVLSGPVNFHLYVCKDCYKRYGCNVKIILDKPIDGT